MRDDRPSSTAVIVAAARAMVDQSSMIEGFSDPYADRLLPRAYRRGTTARWLARVLLPGAHLFALRTMAIDAGVRGAPALEQVVILGAGLDARVWRLTELADIPVFEVDHPSTQGYKRRRAADFESRPSHRYVAVDFERDSLDQ